MFLTALLLYLCYSLYTAWTIWNFKNDDFTYAEVGLVLGTLVVNNKPSIVYENRIKHAVELYKSGKVGKLLFSGGKGDEMRFSEALAGKNFALKEGVSETDIWIEDKSVNTNENFQFSKMILNKERVNSVLIISDPLHMKRAIFLAKVNGINAYASGTPYSFFDSSRKKMFFLMMELPKYHLSRLKHVFR